MRPASNYSIRIDEKVIFTMIIVSVIALLFTAFRYKNYHPCNAFEFSVYANEFNVGNHIFFKASQTQNARTWEWDFGDKSAPDKTSGPITSHNYTQPGQYIVALTINGECKQYQNVIIKNAVKDSTQVIRPQVIWPGNVMVGQNVIFNDITNGANRWEWYIGEGKESKRFTTREVIFTFTKAGSYPVKLFLNGNIDTGEERLIQVTDAPVVQTPLNNRNRNGGRPVYRTPDIKDRPDNESMFDQKPTVTPEEVKPPAPQLTREYFTSMIRGVVEDRVSERDFEPYLCGNNNIRVSFNGDDISFSECISRLRKIKKLKSLKASAYTDKGTNCILGISIMYEKKTFLGL